MEEKLIALLQNAGREDLAIALERDEELDDFIVKHSDELKTIPGFIDLMQPATSSAPHGLSKEDAKEFFTDVKGNVDKRAYDYYFKQEAKYNSELAKRQQIADEYQRSKDLKAVSEFSSDKSFVDNLKALGFKLTPQAAKNVYIKEGYKPVKMGAQAGVSTVANLSEFIPGYGPWSKLIATVTGPALRAGQDIAEGKSAIEVGSNFATDAGLNTLFSYLPLKEAWNYGKRLVGKGGRGEKAVKDAVENTLDQADAIADAKEAIRQLEIDDKNLTTFLQQYSSGTLNDIDMLKYADEISDMYPDLSKAIVEEVRSHGVNRAASKVRDASKQIDESFSKQVNTIAKNANNEAKNAVNNLEYEVRKAQVMNQDKLNALKGEMFDDAGYLKQPINNTIESPVENYLQAAKLANPSKAAKFIAKNKPRVQGVGRFTTGADRASASPEDKEYNSAIEYIIQANRRQWNAGFKPRGGIELEAYNIAKQRGEI